MQELSSSPEPQAHSSSFRTVCSIITQQPNACTEHQNAQCAMHFV